MAIHSILVVDDEPLVRGFLTETLERDGYDVSEAPDGKKALLLLKNTHFDAIITDMKLPGATGLEILKAAKQQSPHCIVIVMTAFGTIENAVEAMRLGAFHYVLKPFTPDTIEALLEKAKGHTVAVEENLYHRQSAQKEVVGESPAILKIMEQVALIAQSSASVMITGESGTGKEVIAHSIHTLSSRVQNPFIKVNCAAVPATLIESEFFGHEKGSFTGATTRRLGRFELAHNGTLLLDEVTEVPLELQAKLLRAIQEQEFERVGGSRPIKVDVRIVATSNRDLKRAIQEKVLREDLYYRLNVIPIFLPPLRDRIEDILPLARFFIEKGCQDNHVEQRKLSPQAEKVLLSYNWPGNVRELSNVIERAIVLGKSPTITPDQLFLDGLKQNLTLDEIEHQHILETLQRHSNDHTKAAESLGITAAKLAEKLKHFH